MRKSIINPARTSYLPVSMILINDSTLSMLQKLFLIELVNLQAQGNEPFLSQSQFAQRNGVSRNTVNLHLRDLINRNIIINHGQGGEGLACTITVSEWFMEQLGYEPVQRKEEVVKNEPKPVPVVEPIVEIKEETTVVQPVSVKSTNTSILDFLTRTPEQDAEEERIINQRKEQRNRFLAQQAYGSSHNESSPF